MSQLSFLCYRAEENLLSMMVSYAETCLFRKAIWALPTSKSHFRLLVTIYLESNDKQVTSGLRKTGKWLSPCLSNSYFGYNPLTFKVLNHNLIFLNWKKSHAFTGVHCLFCLRSNIISQLLTNCISTAICFSVVMEKTV